jgi:hypothetical protein
MTRIEIAKLLGVCSAAFPHVTVTKYTSEVYGELLGDLDFALAMRAVRTILSTHEFFPSVAVIRKTSAELAGSLAPSGTSAWAEVIERVKSSGHTDFGPFTHPTIDATVKMIGWRDICLADNVASVRSHFMKTYEGLKVIHDRPALVGSSQRALEAL